MNLPLPDAPPLAAVEYVAIARSLAGYGSEARAFLAALDRQGVEVALSSFPYEDRPELLRAEDRERLDRMASVPALPAAPAIFHVLPTQVPGEWLEGRRCAVRTMEETDGLDPSWIPAANRFDEVWVPGEFNRETFVRAGVDEARIRVVPGCIDTAFWWPGTGDERAALRRSPETFKFLAVFDWMERKGWKTLLEAYCRAFTPRDPVHLTLKVTGLVARATGNAVPTVDAIERFLAERRISTPPRLGVWEAIVSDEKLRDLYRQHDAFVCPSHGEGWGRAHMEAMSCGLPTIGTRWGGNLAFMDDDNSFLVDVERMIPASERHALVRYEGRMWAQPSVEHLAEILRTVASGWYNGKGHQARVDMVDRFSLDAVGPLLKERVAALSANATEAG